MYYLRDRVDGLTTFMPAIVEELVYFMECLFEFCNEPSEEKV